MSSLYGTAADVLAGVLDHKQGLKTLLYASKVKPEMYRKVYALVSQTISYRSVIDQLMLTTKLNDIAKNPKNRYTVMIMIYDLLFGQKRINSGGSLKKAIMARATLLNQLLERRKKTIGATSNSDLIPVEFRERPRLPRYARINTLLTNQDDVLKQLSQYEIVVDEHVRDLLVVPADVEMYDHALVQSSHLILQDKASCFPAQILLDTDRPLRHLIDACSAPGNKTLQLAAGLASGAKLTAFERDRIRYNTLCRRVAQAGAADRIETRCADFRSCSPRDDQFADVDAVLIDPSCSGSGLSGYRVDAMLQNATMSEGDIQRLQSQQIELILHAMRFPNVFRITYSTCSTHRIENEDVVEKVLRRQSGWELATAMPSFPGRGIPNESFPNADLCIRSSAEYQTHGFFVALFAKKEMTNADDCGSSGALETVDEARATVKVANKSIGKKIARKRKLKRTLLLK